jgi:hypothetical protein
MTRICISRERTARRVRKRLPYALIATSTMVVLGVGGLGCGQKSGSPAGAGGAGGSVPSQPLVVSTATRTPITTTRSVSYWDWMPSYGSSVAGTEALVAALRPAIIRVGGYNNDVNMADAFDDTAFDAAVAYARAIGAEPLIQAPLLADNTGRPPTPATAAAMVTYANLTKGYRIKYFSVGNEPDLYPDGGMPGNPALPAMPGLTPLAYCTLVRPFVAAMKAADPTIQIVGPDLSYKYQAGNGTFDWLTPILTSCGDLYDIVSIHRYPFEAKQATLAAAAGDVATFKSVIASVRGILSSTGQSAKPLALTETNVVYDATGCVLAASPGTVGSALWMASTVGATIDLGLWTTAVWDISDTDDYSLGLIGLPPAHTPRPAYHAYRLFADHFGSTHVDVTKTPPGVTAYASRNQADDTTQIMAVNWNQAPAGLEVQVTGLPKTPASATFLLPPVSLAAIEVPDGRPAMAWTYGEAQRQTASGPAPLPAGAAASAGGSDGGTSTASGAGKIPGTSCATDGGVICAKLVPPSPAITTMGTMSGSGVSFGSGVEAWASYSYAGSGQSPPTATVTADGLGLEIVGGFSASVTADANFAGFGLYLAGSSCLDASGYTGIAFDFSGGLGGCNLQAGMNFSGNDAMSNDSVRGACSGTTSQCYGPSADVTSGALATTASSPTIRVPFAAFVGGMPNPTADPSTIVAIQWQLTASLGSADGGMCAAHFTVRNVSFYK